MKEGTIQKAAAADERELALINAYTRREFTAQELYVFGMTLCDNEVDRDFEKFSSQALEKLAELFVGKPGLFDHEPKAALQAARIFAAKVEEVPGRVTCDGEPYRRLTARAYLPRTADNAALVTEIEGGIKKEVSVGCAVQKRTCSICGQSGGRCGHTRGQYYDGKLCYFLLEEPTDAYEWSFVAVPAQREAGVTKTFGAQADSPTTLQALLKSHGALKLNEREADALRAELAETEKLAQAGLLRREEQTRRILQAAAVRGAGLDMQIVRKGLDALDAQEMERLAQACGKLQTGRPQLAGGAENKDANAAFRF